MPKTRDALKILEWVTGNSSAIKAGIAAASTNLEVAQMIYDARTKVGLSQNEIAGLIGSKQAVSARLEDAGYQGRSLTMLSGSQRVSNNAWSFASFHRAGSCGGRHDWAPRYGHAKSETPTAGAVRTLTGSAPPGRQVLQTRLHLLRRFAVQPLQ